MMKLEFTRMKKLIVSARLALALSATFAGTVEAASSVQSFSPETNDRFANDPAFVGTGFDFSGIGRDSSGRWLTMLSDRVFISANHLAPGGTVTFFPGNDPLATPVTATISEGERIGTTDLWIGRLGTALPGSIASYGFSTVSLTEANFAASSLANAFSFMGGISPTGTGYGASVSTNETVGTNRIEGFQEDVFVASADNATGDVLITVQNNAGDSAYGYTHTTYETNLASGDSGSPLLMVSGGDLVVAGIALGVGTATIGPAETQPRDFTAFTYTGSYSSEIQDYLDATLVPEPSFALLAGLGLVFVRRRR